MADSSSVGAGPYIYDPGSAAANERDTNETLACNAAITPAPAHNEPELCSPNPETDLLQNKEKPEVSRRQHRRPRPPYQQDRVSAQLHSNRNDAGSGWCELYALKSVEAAAEELRVNDVDVQFSADNAELLSQLTAGTYA